jgi:uncharacterized protein with HEPN domain
MLSDAIIRNLELIGEIINQLSVKILEHELQFFGKILLV